MMGMCVPVFFSLSRMRAVASKPSISGIWMSIRITSNVSRSKASRDKFVVIIVVGKCQIVVVDGKAYLEAGHPARTGEQREIDGFSVVGVLEILRRIRAQKRGATVPQLSHIINPKSA